MIFQEKTKDIWWVQADAYVWRVSRYSEWCNATSLFTESSKECMLTAGNLNHHLSE